MCAATLSLVLTSIVHAVDTAEYVRTVSKVTETGRVTMRGSAVLLVPNLGIYFTAAHALTAEGSLTMGGKAVTVIDFSTTDDAAFFIGEPVDLPAPAFKNAEVGRKYLLQGFLPELGGSMRSARFDGDYLGVVAVVGYGDIPFSLFSAKIDYGMSGGGAFLEATCKDDAPSFIGGIVKMVSEGDGRAVGISSGRIKMYLDQIQTRGNNNMKSASTGRLVARHVSELLSEKIRIRIHVTPHRRSFVRNGPGA